MKKLFLALLAFGASNTSLFGCQILLTNTTKDAIVTVFDQGSSKTVEAKEGQVVKANTDPDQRARLVISITIPEFPTRMYYLEQFACSKSHEIPVTSQQIRQGFSKQPGEKEIEKLIKVKPMRDRK